MTQTPNLAIIILNWNGFEDTVKCLQSVTENDYSHYKIVLVDNGSENSEGEKLKQLFPQVHLIQNKVNRGFAGGNNDGINWAFDHGCDYIINLNNDCVVTRPWLSQLIAGIISVKADFGSSMILFEDSKDLIASDEDVLLPDGSALSIHRNQPHVFQSKSRPIFGACGAGSIYSKQALQAVRIKENQYFNEMHFAFYEDIDLAMRLHMKDFRAVVVPEAVIYHKHSKTAGKYSEFKIFHSEKNRILNEILNFPVPWIVLGEIFFCTKVFLGLVYAFFNPQSKAGRYKANIKVSRMAPLFLKARWWIIQHFSQILGDRRERKQRGFIKNRVCRYFNWNIIKFVK